MKPIAEKHPIARQTQLVHDDFPDIPIIWTHWRDGRITRQVGEDGEVIKIDFATCYKVDHGAYLQWTNFFTIIADNEYRMSYQDAIKYGILPARPETIDERAERRKKWYEKQVDRRVKIMQENE